METWCVGAGAEEHQVDDGGRDDRAVQQFDPDRHVCVAAADRALGDLGDVGVAEEGGERGGRQGRAAVPGLMPAGLVAGLPGPRDVAAPKVPLVR